MPTAREKLGGIPRKEERKGVHALEDFIICHDEKNCELQPGKETEFAEKFDEFAPLLLPEQKEIIIEEFLGRRLLSDDRAFLLIRPLPDESKMRIGEYIGKVLRAGEYTGLLMQLMTAEDKGWRYDLLNFFITQAQDRYPDVALFDRYATDLRFKALINDDERARYMAKMLIAHGEKVDYEQGKKIFSYLFEHQPLAIIRELGKLQNFDNENRGEDELLIEALSGVSRQAFRMASEEIPEPQFSQKLPREARARRYNEYVRTKEKRTHEITNVLVRKVLAELTPHQKEAILKSDLYGELLTFFITNLREFRDCSKEVFENALKRGFEYGGFYFSKDNIALIQEHGLEDAVVRHALRVDNPSIWSEVYKNGDIRILKRKNIQKILQVIAEKRFVILFENPELMQEYNIKSPRNYMQEVSGGPSADKFVDVADKFLQYAQTSKSFPAKSPYRITEKEIYTTLRAIADTRPDTIFYHPAIFKKIYSLDEQKNILGVMLEKKQFIDMRNMLYQWDEWRTVFEGSEELTELLLAHASADADTPFKYWEKMQDIIKERERRTKFIFDHFEQIKQYMISKEIVQDCAHDAETLRKFMEKVSYERPDLLPRCIKILIKLKTETNEEDIRNLLEEHEEEFIRKPLGVARILMQNETLLLDNIFEYDNLAAHDPELKEMLKRIEFYFPLWCAHDPGTVWDARSIMQKHIGTERWEELVLEYREFLYDEMGHEFSYNDVFRRRETRHVTRFVPRSEKFMRELGQKILEENPTSFYIPDGYRANIASELKIQNPRKLIWGNIQKQKFFSFYGKELRAQFALSEKLSSGMITKEFFALARTCGILSRAPFADTLLRLTHELPRKVAERMLDRARACISLGERAELAKDLEKITNITDIIRAVNERITRKFKDTLGIEVKDSDSRIFERPEPVLIYAARHKDEKRLTDLLRVLVEQNLAGTYKEWHYFDNQDPATGLESMKTQGLLPKELTLDQYQKWISDDVAREERTLEIDLHDIYNQNERILRDAIALEHCTESGLQDVFDLERAALQLEEVAAPLHDLQDRISELQEIFEENKKRKKQGEVEMPYDKSAFDAAKTELANYLQARGTDIKKRRAVFYLAKLLRISENDAQRNVLNVYHKKNAEVPLRRVFTLLREAFEAYPEFINDIGKIEQNLASVGTLDGGGKQGLVVSDATDLMLAMEIGEKPVDTCQHWERGSNNEALLAYAADPNTKIITVRGTRGQLIARSIARLLSDEAGNSVLHLEGVYSANLSPEIEKIIVDFGRGKARALGIPLTIGGREMEWRAPNLTLKGKINLASFGSRNVSVYVDSAQGLESDGKYTIIGANIIS